MVDFSSPLSVPQSRQKWSVARIGCPVSECRSEGPVNFCQLLVLPTAAGASDELRFWPDRRSLLQLESCGCKVLWMTSQFFWPDRLSVCYNWRFAAAKCFWWQIKSSDLTGCRCYNWRFVAAKCFGWQVKSSDLTGCRYCNSRFAAAKFAGWLVKSSDLTGGRSLLQFESCDCKVLWMTNQVFSLTWQADDRCYNLRVATAKSFGWLIKSSV